MAKVRVPKDERPPTRFGVITQANAYTTAVSGGRYRVEGSYRAPKVGEVFWAPLFGYATTAVIKFDDPYVILVPA